MSETSGHYLALCGGVGGAKLADGLARVLRVDALTIAVNVGDDFEHLGLPICPDLDTVLYTLAGLAHPQQGWGRAEESWRTFGELRRLGGADWFQLGDLDIALHLLRRSLLDSGASLSQAIAAIGRKLGVQHAVTPVTDEPLRTIVQTDEGILPFQDYFVRRRCEPRVAAVNFAGAERTRLAPSVAAALQNPALAGVILCPSNPYVSINPMLAVPGLRERLRACPAPIIAVSPIVGGQALKGPAAKIMQELGVVPSAGVIADLYSDFVDSVLVDTTDAALARSDARLLVTGTVMHTTESRAALASFCVDLCQRIQHRAIARTNQR
jgi:LPPG:FO 2-phospho-L-lactate transferase